MHKYRFRSECLEDVMELAGVLEEMSAPAVMIVTRDPVYPDCEVEVRCNLPVEKLRGFCGTVEDGHVMAETLDFADAYDGERRYGLEWG